MVKLYVVIVGTFLSLAVLTVVRCDVYRLPKTVKPVRYMLQMEPDLTWRNDGPYPYHGSIVMEIKATENTDSVTFHVNNLLINKDSIKLQQTYGKDIKVTTTSGDPETETYTVHFENDLIKGERYYLTIGDFSGKLGKGEGFFLAKYWRKNDDKPKGIVAATHFEPTGARKAFPCFDEPALKARFVISLIRPEGYTSLSNQELEMTQSLGNGRFRDTFKETPDMSTFTVAFVISDFPSTEKLERHRIFARPKVVKNQELKNSLKTSVKTLQVLEEFTGINFTLNKMDSFAVPDGYFFEHAMENWGLVVYGEGILRFSNKSSVFDLKRIATYIAHEFSHQWFGNLVTPEWWAYLWLSESLAAYFQYYIASLVKPEWRLMDQFLVDVVIKSFSSEEFSYEENHSLTYPIRYTGEYPPRHIMYQKGASLVNMMSHFLTPDVFRKGLQIYLESKKFSTAVPSDLYGALQQAVDDAQAHGLLDDHSVSAIFNTWEHLTGFPIVTVSRDYKTGDITAIQTTKFKEYNKNNGKKLWKIPVNYVFSYNNQADFAKTIADFWLTEQSKTVNKNFPTEGWLIVNKQQTGYYRVNYDAENWNRIIKVLKSDNFESIHVLNRAQLINDALYLSHHDEMPFKTAITLCEYLVREKDYIPWNAFYNGVSSYVKIYYGGIKDSEYEYFRNHPLNKTVTPPKLDYGPARNTFHQYIRALTKNIRDYLGNELKPNESILDTMNREEVHKYFSSFFDDDDSRDYKLMLSLLN